MPKKAELKVKIKGDKSNLDSVLRGAKAALKSFGNAAIAGMKAVAVSAGVASVALAYGVKKAYDLGGELSDMAKQTGIAVDQLLLLNQAGKDAGIDDMATAINKLQKALVDSVQNGAGPAAKALEMLGLRGEDLIKKTPVDQIQAIGEALQKIKSPALSASITRDLFGNSGPKMQAFLGDREAMTNAAAAVGKQAQILKDNAEKFDAVSDRLGHAGLKLQGFFVGVAKGVLPGLDAVTERLDKMDLADQGIKFGEALSKGAEKIVDAFETANGLVMIFGPMIEKATGKLLEVAGAIMKMSPLSALAGAKSLPGIWDMIPANVKMGAKASVGAMMTAAKEVGTPQEWRPRAAQAVAEKTPWYGYNTTLSSGGLRGASMAHSAGYFESQATGFTKGGINGGFGSTSSLTRPAYGQTPLLSLRERRRSQNIQVAEGADRDIRASTAGAYGVVRAGDSKRAEKVARQKLRDEETLKGTNAHLKAIETATQKTADAVSD